MDALVYFFRVGFRAGFKTRYPLHLPRSIKCCTSIRRWGGRVWGKFIHISRRGAEEQFGKTGYSKAYGEYVRSLLGAGAIRKDEESIILCLCEKELLILRNML